MKKLLLTFFALLVLTPKLVLAHCPLCVAGAGALAVVATYLGISSMIIGVLIGAFALALGMWIAKMLKKKYVPYQYLILTIIIFLSTIIPIIPLIKDYAPLYIPFVGKYGTTYAVNLFLAGLPFGILTILIAPFLSKKISDLRSGKIIPYQGIAITITLLIIISLLIQFL